MGLPNPEVGLLNPPPEGRAIKPPCLGHEKVNFEICQVYVPSVFCNRPILGSSRVYYKTQREHKLGRSKGVY